MKRDATETDLKRLDALRDESIDYSDIPALDADFFREAQALRRARAELTAASMQRASLAAGTDRLTLDEINSEIAAVREARARSVRRTMT